MQGGIVLALFTTLAFAGIFLRSEALIREAVTSSASSYIDLVVDTRLWNASHGGVWVAKSATVRENPYLRQLGVEPDTRTVSGTILTMRNPSAMTTELSTISESDGRVSFHLTSLKPLNVDHAPDAWEREVLKRFEVDPAEVSRIQSGPNGRTLRLMRPLHVDPTCLRCHGEQGVRVGDVRGAVSVSASLARTDGIVRQNAFALVGIWLCVMVVGGFLMRVLIKQMIERIECSEGQLLGLATTDSLTGIANRRAVLDRLDTELARARREGGAVGVISIDADNFKHVNDAYGHAFGDIVLREITARVAGIVREYDAVGRIGGEEFLVVAPDITKDGLATLAERLRAAVADAPIRHNGTNLEVSISLGAALSAPEEDIDGLLARADFSLYAAKEAGRNRVVLT